MNRQSVWTVDGLNGPGDRPAARETAMSTVISVAVMITGRRAAEDRETERVGLAAFGSGRLHLQACIPEQSINRFGLRCLPGRCSGCTSLFQHLVYSTNFAGCWADHAVTADQIRPGPQNQYEKALDRMRH